MENQNEHAICGVILRDPNSPVQKSRTARICCAIQRTTKSAALLVIVALVSTNADLRLYGAVGDLDITFDSTGKFTQALGNDGTYVRGLWTKDDGSIVVSGWASGIGNNPSAILFVEQLTPIGAVDTNFHGGYATLAFTDLGGTLTGGGISGGQCAIQPDGKILLAGTVIYNGGATTFGDMKFFVARFNTNGVLDTSFNGSGFSITAIGNVKYQSKVTSRSVANSITVQPDGKIIVVGYSYIGSNNVGGDDLTIRSNMVILRYNSTGTLDSTFNGSGIATKDPKDDGSVAGGDYECAEIQPDGKIVVAGHLSDPGLIVARYNQDGTLDHSFNGTGTLVKLGTSVTFRSIAIQKDGKILLCGNPSTTNIILFRLNSNGTPDWPLTGISTPLTGSQGGRNMLLQSDGKIIVVGGNGNTFASARYLADGTIDTKLGTNGIVTTAFSSPSNAGAVALDRQGRLVVAGYVDSNSAMPLLGVARYLSDKSPLILIPGIAASVLSLNGTQLWPSIWASDIQRLSLRPETPGILATDILRTATVETLLFGKIKAQDVYTPMVAHLNSTGYKEFVLSGVPSNMTDSFQQCFSGQQSSLPNFFPFPYDWRRGYESNTETLHRYIANIRALHGGAKVDILAHSAGGLLLRRYVLDYGTEDINHVATVGTPFWGAPVAVYRLLAGDLFDFPLVDAIVNAEVRMSLATFPGFHELLPSDLYMQNAGMAMVSENGYDLNHLNGSHEEYSLIQYKSLIDSVAGPNMPTANNYRFHSYKSGRQDNWSGDSADIKYLHICGIQNQNMTFGGVVARESPNPYPPGTTQNWTFSPIQEIVPVPVNGDGVVPLLSAERTAGFLAPNSILKTISGENEDVQHTSLMHHQTVYDYLDAFLADLPLPQPPPAPAAPPPSSGYFKYQVTIKGIGYARITNSAGQENTKIGDLGALAVPGFKILYGGDQPWIDVKAFQTGELNIEGASANLAIEVELVEINPAGVASSFRRYSFSPAGHNWHMKVPDWSVSLFSPLVTVDLNDDGADQELEAVPAVYTGTSLPAKPSVQLNLTKTSSGLVLNLSSSGGGAANPEIFYTLDDGPVEKYLETLSFPVGKFRNIKTFSRDANGSLSGLIDTALKPNLTVGTQSDGSISLNWNGGDGYLLQEASRPSGPWITSSAQTFNIGGVQSAVIKPKESRKFFRLSFQSTTK